MQQHICARSLLAVLLGLCAPGCTAEDNPEQTPSTTTTGTVSGGTTGDGDSTNTNAPQTTTDAAAQEPQTTGVEDAGSTATSGAANAGSDADATTSVADAAAEDAEADDPLLPTLPSCGTGDTEACGTFVSSKGKELPLGPYGAKMEVNVGADFKTALASGDRSASTCESVAASFGEPEDGSATVLATGDLDFTLYTVYSPARPIEGETYPVLTWGNGTCAAPEGYGALLRYVASHGFVVVAANSRWVGSGQAQRQALDFIFAANENAQSPYYGMVDTAHVAAAGHSQGGMGTTAASEDPRIQTAILFNSGSSAPKPFLALTGDHDIGDPQADAFARDVLVSPRAAYLFYHMIPETGNVSGHLTLMTQPERVTEATVAWLKYILLDDAESREYFVEPECKLCGRDADFEYGSVGLQ